MFVFYCVFPVLWFSDGELDMTFSGDGLVTTAIGVSEQANFILIHHYHPANTNPISVDPILSETSWFQVTVSDPVSMAQNATQVPILVHQAGILDWNLDGCNTLQDLWDAAHFWNQTYANDPNGDGKIDVRDFQYINTDDPSSPENEVSTDRRKQGIAVSIEGLDLVEFNLVAGSKVC